MTRPIAHNGHQFDFAGWPGEGPDDRESDEAALARWWASLPDFIRPDYPFDVPPTRLAFARHVFTEVGAPRFCPEGACRRSGACRGGDGPPCYRADRAALRHVLLLWWMALYADLPREAYAQSLRAKAGRYARAGAQPAAEAKPGKGRARGGNPRRMKGR
jgi:hypothetical protein